MPLRGPTEKSGRRGRTLPRHLRAPLPTSLPALRSCRPSGESYDGPVGTATWPCGREVYLRFLDAEQDQVTLRLRTELRSTAATVFLGAVLLPPERSGRTLGFSEDLMAGVEEL